MNNLIEDLNWRYAAKRMNGQTIPQEKLDTILEVIKLSPSSVGLQPYNIVVISDQDTKDRIFKEAAPQQQIPEASHLLVFAAWEKITAQQITDYMNLIATTRGISVESLSKFQESVTGGILSRSEEVNFNWAARQAYIALGHALVAAATEHVDATPMEGFNNAKLDEILGLTEKGLKSVVIMTLGYRDSENDALSNAKKVRRSHEELFISL
ncbi:MULTISPECIES: NAD(P)H-dependent oxidoreductase [Dyadobacter]|uniref:NAD(P)H-dependent oxidoreductase n=1 Tax=Dyadobacter chenhuakuii TaxID=2909339 RepID=A0ABY4XL18_9BACT|nr:MULTISPECIES: NAD(P)H-dependent oxidoreductase [Dyadobacter]MCF2493775.1 NAD(P)H-dependent oxidoreductase [Dyadobacter chenhuakuii]MCF2518020.1 NAD(P)H-dependent oxidoreductase [Dyadobacter sp. CY351]USJ30909.1 NAD(P)H-dependent oxidoreductase [Dyadobacter chenhuakuii]